MGSEGQLPWNNLGDVMDGQDGSEDRKKNIDDGSRGESQQQKTPSRRFKRHSRDQTKELKAVFSACPHPDETQRLELSKMLGMNATQVKHWFQNQRSQMKNHVERQKGKALREENEMLREENMAFKEAMRQKACLTCGGPTVMAEEVSEQLQRRLRTQNAKLKGEILTANEFLTGLSRQAARPPLPAKLPCYGLAVVGSGGGSVLDRKGPALPFADHGRPALADDDHAALLRRVDRAAQELMMLMSEGQPMWLPTPDGEALDEQCYAAATFPGLLGLRPVGFVLEGTRAAGVVMGTAADIVGVLVDVARWSEMLPEVVADATPGVVIVPGAGGNSHDGLIQLMNVELRVLSPQVPVRTVRFARRSKLLEPGKWCVVDVSVDGALGHHGGGGGTVDLNAQNGWALAGHTACRLLPTGCLIEDMNNGYCKITWIVNAEYDETTVPQLYHPLLRSGQALGARRWLAALQRNSEYLAVMRRAPAPGLSNAAISPEGRRSVLELARRMMAGFYAAVWGPVAQAPPCGVEQCHGGAGAGGQRFAVAVRVVTTPGEHAGGGLVLNAATTVWLPGTPAQRVFDYLCGWNALDDAADMVEEGYVITGQIMSNAVSVLHPVAADGASSKNLILKEARTDSSCSMVVYSPVDAQAMRSAMSGGGGQASIVLLPSGFAVLPDGHSKPLAVPPAAAQVGADPIGRDGSSGSLVTAMYQAVLSAPPAEKLAEEEAVESLGKLLCGAVEKITAAVKAEVVVAS